MNPSRISVSRFTLAAATAAVFLAFSAGQAADDPSIQGASREGVQKAMQDFIETQRPDGERLLHYDPVDGSLLGLRLVELHAGIVRKGHFFVSCADFADPTGRPYDLDFLVVPGGKAGAYRVNQAIVHAVDGKKRKYHVEQRFPGLF